MTADPENSRPSSWIEGFVPRSKEGPKMFLGAVLASRAWPKDTVKVHEDVVAHIKGYDRGPPGEGPPYLPLYAPLGGRTACRGRKALFA